MKGTLTLSTKEIDRLMLISQIEQEKISVLEASSLMELSQRQIYRKLKRVKAEGAKGTKRKNNQEIQETVFGLWTDTVFRDVRRISQYFNEQRDSKKLAETEINNNVNQEKETT